MAHFGDYEMRARCGMEGGEGGSMFTCRLPQVNPWQNLSDGLNSNPMFPKLNPRRSVINHTIARENAMPFRLNKSITKQSITNVATLNRIGLFVTALLTFWVTGCVEQKMTVKDARQVTVTMQDTAFTPPPRKINDVLAVLEEPGKFDPGITSAFARIADVIGGSDA